jgi:putative transposase
MNADGGLAMQRMLELGRVSRSSFYRFDPDRKAGARDMELRDAIQRVALEWPCYGRPRITAELRRQGWTVNPKRVYRLMREDNLLWVQEFEPAPGAHRLDEFQLAIPWRGGLHQSPPEPASASPTGASVR